MVIPFVSFRHHPNRRMTSPIEKWTTAEEEEEEGLIDSRCMACGREPQKQKHSVTMATTRRKKAP